LSVNDREEIYALAADIFPIRRSITGSGVRQTLENAYIKE
jgi:aminopeptidase-like protein